MGVSNMKDNMDEWDKAFADLAETTAALNDSAKPRTGPAVDIFDVFLDDGDNREDDE